MRKYKLFIGILVGVLIIGAFWHICKLEHLPVSQISLTERDDLGLEVETVDCGGKSVTLLITNDGDDAVFISPWIWSMDRKKDSVWYSLESIRDVLEIPLIDSTPINAGETKKFAFNWGSQYGAVGSGMYRIYFKLHEEGDTDYIGVEFAIDGWKELFL